MKIILTNRSAVAMIKCSQISLDLVRKKAS